MVEDKIVDLTAGVGRGPITHRPCNLRQITGLLHASFVKSGFY